MGLDMHLTGEKYQFSDYHHPEKNPMEDGFRVKSRQLELGYWRKHPDLHGYIIQEFAEGIDECQEIELSKENMEQIIKAIEDKNLPTTEGFFFGNSSSSDDQHSIEQLEGAIKWLGTNEKDIFRSVSYRASW